MKLNNKDNIFEARNHIFNGQSIFTLFNNKNKHHFTFKIIKAKYPEREVYWVFALCKLSKGEKYRFRYLGSINKYGYRFDVKSLIHAESNINRAMVWLFEVILNDKKSSDQVELYTNSFCKVCKKILIKPSELELGMDKACYEKSENVPTLQKIEAVSMSGFEAVNLFSKHNTIDWLKPESF